MSGEHSPPPVPPAATETARAVQASPQLSLQYLAGEHRRLLDRAIAAILATALAEVTYAQIVDGKPIERPRHISSNPYYKPLPPPTVPIPPAHTDLCPGMLEKVREFRRQFCSDILIFDSKVSFILLPLALGC
jgi:hypothetical protein